MISRSPAREMISSHSYFPSERARLILCMPYVCTFLRAFNRSNTAGWTLGLAAAPVRAGSRNSATVGTLAEAVGVSMVRAWVVLGVLWS
jgi:hypothetical protein